MTLTPSNISSMLALMFIGAAVLGPSGAHAGEKVTLPLGEIIEKSRPSHGLQGSEHRRERLDQADSASDAPGQPEIFRQHSKRYQELDRQGRFIKD